MRVNWTSLFFYDKLRFDFGDGFVKSIEKDSIDIINLKHIYSSESAETYRDDDTVYKFFDDITHPFTLDHAKKARAMNHYRFVLDKRIILPNAMIRCEGLDAGYTTRYVSNSRILASYEVHNYDDLRHFYHYLYDVCHLLKNLHKHGIVVGDFHFHNVLLQNEQIYMIDFDNVRIGNMLAYTPSFLLQAFTQLYEMPLKAESINEETDRLSLLLSTLQIFLGDQTIFLSGKNVEEMRERYVLVNNIMAELSRVIKKREIVDIPLPSDLVVLKKRPF